jgi:hypothetical protein
MDPAHQPPTGHTSSNLESETQPQLGASSRDEPWPLSEGERTDGGAGSSSTPYVSLFSPHVPALPPSAPSDPAGSPRAHVSHSRSLSYSRSMPSLANYSSMTSRASRTHASDDRPPIVQLQTRIDQAQKSADDPNTPLEEHGKRRTTLDLMRSEHSVRTDISRLFSESAAMPGTRAPSYTNATGPLYLRGEDAHKPRSYTR